MLNRWKLAKAYQDVFSTKEGKVVLHDLLRYSNWFRSMRGDPYNVAFANGQRDVACRVAGFLNMNPIEAAQEAKSYTITNTDEEFDG